MSEFYESSSNVEGEITLRLVPGRILFKDLERFVEETENLQRSVVGPISINVDTSEWFPVLKVIYKGSIRV